MPLIDWLKDNLPKYDFYSIPYWDRLRISQMGNPDYDTGVVHLWSKTLDRSHYLLSQVVLNDGEYIKYELLLVTIHGLRADGSYTVKHYEPIKQIWFY